MEQLTTDQVKIARMETFASDINQVADKLDDAISRVETIKQQIELRDAIRNKDLPFYHSIAKIGMGSVGLLLSLTGTTFCFAIIKKAPLRVSIVLIKAAQAGIMSGYIFWQGLSDYRFAHSAEADKLDDESMAAGKELMKTRIQAMPWIRTFARAIITGNDEELEGRDGARLEAEDKLKTERGDAWLADSQSAWKDAKTINIPHRSLFSILFRNLPPMQQAALTAKCARSNLYSLVQRSGASDLPKTDIELDNIASDTP